MAALRRLTTLRHVDLASNEFGDDAIELVARACVHYVRDLYVNENPFSHVGGRALLDAVRASTTIRRLYARHRTSHSTPCVSLKLEWLAMLRRGDAWPLDDCETSLVARTIGIDAWRLVARASFGNRSLYTLDLNSFPNEHAIDQALNALFYVRCMKYLV